MKGEMGSLPFSLLSPNIDFFSSSHMPRHSALQCNPKGGHVGGRIERNHMLGVREEVGDHHQPTFKKE